MQDRTQSQQPNPGLSADDDADRTDMSRPVTPAQKADLDQASRVPGRETFEHPAWVPSVNKGTEAEQQSGANRKASREGPDVDVSDADVGA